MQYTGAQMVRDMSILSNPQEQVFVATTKPTEVCMIERIERQHSYSMNRLDTPVIVCPEPDETVEFTRTKLPMPRRRVPGEALVKFGHPRRKEIKPVLAQSTAPFNLRRCRMEIPKTAVMQVQAAAPACTPEVLVGSPEKSCIDGIPVVVLPPKKRPHIGQEILLDGRRAILTWLGETKFEVAIAGKEAKQRFKHSEYPSVKRGKTKVNRIHRETSNAAS